MVDAFLGEIRAVGFDYAPDGWLTCNGQTLPISQYDALFSILGNRFGGDGATTFSLPNLNQRIPMGNCGDSTIGKEERFYALDSQPCVVSIPEQFLTFTLKNASLISTYQANTDIQSPNPD